ncbi:MAG: NfeD family protein [bacterium]|nr:NfeD family protein [bacterium]
MIWWLWVVLGSLLLVIEMITPGGFYIFFFGVGAILTGLLLLFGIPMKLALQIILFLVISVVSLILFRKRLMQKMESSNSEKVDSVIGESAISTSEIPVDEVGTVEFRGVPWKAKNIGSKPIEKGNTCYIKKVVGLRLDVSLDQE